MVSATLAWAVDVNTEALLIEALANSSNTEITLTSDISLTTTLTISRDGDVTLDLNGHNITSNGFRAIRITKGAVTITSTSPATISTSGSIGSNSSVIRVGNGFDPFSGTKNTVSLTVDENVTVSTDKCYGITVFGSETTETLIVNGKVTTTDINASAISGNGNPQHEGTTITIGEHAVISSGNDVAIYHPQAGTLTVQGTVSGLGGIEMKSGRLVVEEKAKITANAPTTTHTANNDGTSTRGYAIAIVENGSYAGVSTINISPKAEINGPIAVVKDSDKKDGAPEITFDPSGIQMKVKVTDSSEKIVGQYLSLELAVKEAATGNTITLLDNYTMAETIESEKAFTLDLDTCTLTSEIQPALYVKSGEVIIKTSKTGDKGGDIIISNATDPAASAIRVGSDETGAGAVSLKIAQGVTLTADEGYGITIAGKNSTQSLTVEGNVKTKSHPAITGSGAADLAETTIAISASAQIKTTANVAIYHPQNGTLTIQGSAEGAGGVEMKGGNLVVGSMAKITANGTPTHTPATDAPSSLGYAIAIVENASANGVSSVTINNTATIDGIIAELQDSEKVGFNPDYVQKSDNGNAVSNKVASIHTTYGDDKYFQMKDAIMVVPSQGTVRMLNDLTLSETLVMNQEKTYTLDLDGKTLTGNGCAALRVSHGHVTATNGMITSTTGAPAAVQVGSDEGGSRNISLTINANAKVSTTASTGVLLKGSVTRETLEVLGKITTTGYRAIVAEDEVAKIHVAKDAEVSASNATAIYQANTGELVIDGKVPGKDAIKMYGGNLTVSKDATITADTETNYAIALVEKNGSAGVGRANISNQVTITGVIACPVESKNNSVVEPMFTGDIYMIAETKNSNSLWEKYARITDAIAATTTDGAEVKLLDDLNIIKTVTIGKSITLNMDDYSLINNHATDAAISIAQNVTVTLKNGGISSAKTGDPATEIANQGIVISNGNISLEQMTLKTGGVSLTVKGGTVTVDQKSSLSALGDTTVVQRGGTLTVSGKVLNTSTETNLNQAIAATAGDLTIESAATISSAKGNGIDWQSAGTLTVNGGKIMGAKAMYANAGTVTIKGGTFTGTGNAVEIVNETAEDCNATIEHGTFMCGNGTSDVPIASTGANAATGFVQGDYFSKAIVQNLCAPGYMVSKNPRNNGLYYLIDEIVINDGTQWVVPTESFEIATAKYIRNSGMGAHGTKFGTLCLPFSIDPTASQCIPEGMTFYEVESINAEKSEITITKITSKIAAGTPVVFEFADNTTNFEIVSTQATISNTTAQIANNLVGTYQRDTIVDGLTDIYYLNSDAFHQATSSLIVPAFRAYIKFAPSPSSTPERPDVFNIVIEGESTRLDQLREDISEEMIFDLNGIRQARLMPGMNIVKMKDGRTIKVYVNK